LKKQTLYAIGAILSLSLAVLFTVLPWAAADGEQESSQTQTAPAFKLTDMQGNPVSIEGLKGKTVLVNFWATWCGPCRKEIPDFVELQEEYGDKGLVIVGLSVDRGGETVVRDWMAKNTVNYSIALAGDTVYNAWQQLLPASDRGVIPTSYLVDSEGVVRYIHIGLQDKAAWEGVILPLLPEMK
jgi:thiol-disulfide isomerase/thioredoxin